MRYTSYMNLTKQPRLSAVVAMAENRVIGNQNKLPWQLPADLRHFKALTSGHAILMGRKTYQSIGKPLPNRTNIILTRDAHFIAPGCVVVTSIAEAIQHAIQINHNEIFVIGGAEIYAQLLPQINRIYLTIIHHHFVGDAYFPLIKNKEWREVNRENHSADTDNPYAYSFITLDKIVI